jgi:hypothetical protein
LAALVIAPSTSADGRTPAHFDLPLPNMARFTVCFAEGAKKCRNCKSIFYYSGSRKKSDGYLHKMVCGKFTKFATRILGHPTKRFLQSSSTPIPMSRNLFKFKEERPGICKS